MRTLILALVLVACSSVNAPTGPTAGVRTLYAGMDMRGSGVVLHSSAQGTLILTAGHGIGPHGLLPPWKGASYSVQLGAQEFSARYVAHAIEASEDGTIDCGLLVTGAPAVAAVLSEDGDVFGGSDLEVRAWRGGEAVLEATLSKHLLSTRPDVELGDSGSGVYARGELVGMVNAIVGRGLADTRFIRWRALAAFLRAQGFSWLLTRDTSDDPR